MFIHLSDSLMFCFSHVLGVELSAKELIEQQKHKPREIVHENTRFHYTPFSNNKQKEAMQKAATFKALINHGNFFFSNASHVKFTKPYTMNDSHYLPEILVTWLINAYVCGKT